MAERRSFADTARGMGYGLLEGFLANFKVPCLRCRHVNLLALRTDWTHCEFECLKCSAPFTAAGRIWVKANARSHGGNA